MRWPCGAGRGSAQGLFRAEGAALAAIISRRGRGARCFSRARSWCVCGVNCVQRNAYSIPGSAFGIKPRAGLTTVRKFEELRHGKQERIS